MSRDQKGRRLTRQEARKFLLTSSAPAFIQPEEADRFIDYVQDQSQLLREVTVDRMDTNEKEIRFTDITGGILRLMSCPTGPTVTNQATESVDITNTNKCLRTVSLDARFYLCDTDVQDNLTGAELEDQLVRMATDQASNEIEFLALMSNTAGTYNSPATNDPVSVNNAALHARDGYYVQLQQGNVVDAASVGDADNTLTFHKLNCLGRALPAKYAQNLASLRIYMPHHMAWDYAERHQARATELGDEHHLGPIALRHLLTPIRPLQLLPTDVQRCGCRSLASATGTFIFMTEPANLVYGIQNEIQFERERWGMRHITWFQWTIRHDYLVYNEHATSLMDCMALIGCGTSCDVTALGAKCNSCLNLGSGGTGEGLL
jgi:hypothetical protein